MKKIALVATALGTLGAGLIVASPAQAIIRSGGTGTITTGTIVGCPTAVYTIVNPHRESTLLKGDFDLAFGVDAGFNQGGACATSHYSVQAAAWLYALPTNNAGVTSAPSPRIDPNNLGMGVQLATTFGFSARCDPSASAPNCTGAHADGEFSFLPPGIYQVTGWVGVLDAVGQQFPTASGQGFLVDTKFLYDGIIELPSPI